MDKPESYPLLRDAYAIIDGIPEDRIHLNQWRSRGTSPYECGTIACAAGWLAMHPIMQARGLYSGEYGLPCFENNGSYAALAKFFGINILDASDIFCPRMGASNLDPEDIENFSDKELWKFRVQQFLKLNIEPVTDIALEDLKL